MDSTTYSPASLQILSTIHTVASKMFGIVLTTPSYYPTSYTEQLYPLYSATCNLAVPSSTSLSIFKITNREKMDAIPLTRSQVVLAAIIIIITYTIASLTYSARRPKVFPPGPPRIWLLGNLHQISLGTSLIKYQEWKNIYGDILGLKLGPQNAVMLMTAAHVRELFDR
jgi:hypothetical protein